MKRSGVFLADVFCFLVAVFGLLCFPVTTLAQVDGHGPDAYRVVGVVRNDVLNARTGPGTGYAIIDQFAPDAHGLRQITCVPYVPAAHYYAMSSAERDNLPARWCLMQSADFGKAGWVAARYLAEDTRGTSAQSESELMLKRSDEMIPNAEKLVRRLYRSYLASRRGDGDNPLDPENADDFFVKSLVDKLKTHSVQANPLFGGQDFDVKITRIARDADQPMYRGTIQVDVDFTNFGMPQRAAVYLRFDTMRKGLPPLRIIAIEHDGWMF